MNIEKMREFIRLQDELREEGVIGFHTEGALHVRKDSLMNEPGLQIEDRQSIDYPYEIFVEYDGFRVFAIVKAEDLKNFPQFKEQVKAELQKKFAYLEEDVDLSGMEEGEEIA